MLDVLRLRGSSPSADFGRVAALHITSIFHGALPLLGVPFLAELYRQLAETPAAGVWVARRNGAIIGFIAGCSDTPAAFRHVLWRGGVPLALKAIVRMWRPALWRKLASLALYPIRSRSGERDPGGQLRDDVRAELLAMAVDASMRGGGVGRRLVEALENDLLRPSDVRTYIVTTNRDEAVSNSFYRRVGFQPRDTFRHHDLVLQRFAKSIE